MKKSKKEIKVLVGGCFDILHYGHIYFLKQARALGDNLIVAIESDKNIRKLKGKNRPIQNQNQRKEILESLKFVDKAIILPNEMKDKNYFKFVETIKPQIIAVTKGDPLLIKKQDQAESIGAKVVEIAKIKAPSTSQIAKILEVE
jgi:FAD synthetase